MTGNRDTRSKGFGVLIDRHRREDPVFANALLADGVSVMVAGAVEAGRAILARYIEATLGFGRLAEAVAAPPASCPNVQRGRHFAGAHLIRYPRLPAARGALAATREDRASKDVG